MLEAVRATPAPLYAVAYPASGGGWRVSLLEGEDDIRDSFTATDLEAADHALQERGYLSIASAMERDWEKLSPKKSRKERGTPVFRDPGE
ncbi:hypothetical protein ACTFBT_38635 [Streptomyces microflavus]|uniref:hypothetical protein n=1 Tax=Streptomyces TaxID=1883 RepID=UPI000516E39C|nr:MULTISPECIES: hypothetical protein [Streptomyces]MDX2982198.1 hypothetical protein [Streptomyces sp. NRRL_B-2249]GGY00058.1 hypothetical protein GCM10010298_76470 [Streptomyces microflavus]